MSESRLIRTKLHPPRVSAPLVDRARLHARLNGHGGRVILVSAPAGFGKTVFVVDWLGKRTVPTAWLSLDPLDNDPARFCAHLAAAVEGLGVPEATEAAAHIRALSPPGLAVPPGLLEALAAVGPEAVLVLDDLHEVDAPGVTALVETLVHAPRSCPRVVVVTRTDPPFATARLRVSGELLELRERELRFTAEEAVQLFERLLPGVLDPALVRRLGQRTEGWVAGLRLAAIALQDAADPGALVESFAGTHRFIMDYLLEEALERQAPAVQQFLMETSILGRFTAASCGAVTGLPDAAARLEEVEAAGLFLVPLGSDGAWFRYHHLFSEVLRFRLARLQPDRFEELHDRASRWFEAEGDIPAALEHAARLGDPRRLMELLDAHAMDMLARSELGPLGHWLARVPDALAQPYPMLLCVMTWVHVLTVRAPELASLMNASAAALEHAPEGYDPERRRRVRLHLQALAAFAARYAGRFDEALAIGARALVAVPAEDAFTRGVLHFNTARVHMTLGDMGAAGELLESSFNDHLRSGNVYLMLAGLGQAAAVEAQTAGVPRATEALAAAVAFAEKRGLTGYPAFSTVLYHRGHVAYLGDDLEGAEAAFRAAAELGREALFSEGHGNGLLGLARVAMARRRFEEAEAHLVEAEALARGSNVVPMDTTLVLERMRLALAREGSGAGPPVPPLEPGVEDGPWTTVRETELTLALWQAVRAGRDAAAVAYVEELERECARRERGPALCGALLGRALLATDEARWEVLDRALSLAASRGFVRPLLDAGEPLRDVLRAALSRPLSAAARGHARLVVARWDGPGVPVEAAPMAQLVEPLTERELEALACLFRGQSNKAMARTLCVSVDTVKTHLKHIYAKLGVSDRAAAVERARELRYHPSGNGHERTEPESART